MGTFVLFVFAQVIATWKLYLAAWVVLVGLELALPRGRPTLASRLKAGAIWLVSIPLVALPTSAVLFLLPRPLVSLHLPMLAGAAVGLLVGDFFYYWYHRAMHRWFWPIHAVHHSIRDLNAVSAYIHPLDDLIRIGLVTIPSGLLLGGAQPVTVTALGLVTVLHGHLNHAATKVSLGPLRRLLTDNRFHRLHHSFAPEHLDCNFGSSVTIWDQVFGTAVFPRPGEWPETGVPDRPEPEGVGAYLLQPFRSR